MIDEPCDILTAAKLSNRDVQDVALRLFNILENVSQRLICAVLRQLSERADQLGEQWLVLRGVRTSAPAVLQDIDETRRPEFHPRLHFNDNVDVGIRPRIPTGNGADDSRVQNAACAKVWLALPKNGKGAC